jgi:hypothetical protein
MPPSFPTPNTVFPEDTKDPIPGLFSPVYEDIYPFAKHKDPIPGLFSPVYEDIYPFAKHRPAFLHQPTSNTIAPDNAPEDNLGLLCFSIY